MDTLEPGVMTSDEREGARGRQETPEWRMMVFGLFGLSYTFFLFGKHEIMPFPFSLPLGLSHRDEYFR